MAEVTALVVQKERITVPVNGEGILDADFACEVFERYSAVIMNDAASIDFEIGPRVKITLPEFWQTVLSKPMMSSVDKVEKDFASWETQQEHDFYLREGRFMTTFRFDPPNPSAERNRECSEIAHRFVGVINPFLQYIGHKSLEWEWNSMGRPGEAQRMRIVAQGFKAGVLMGFKPA
jgi:hypothetical protein